MPLTRPPLSFLNSNSTVFTDPLLVLHQGSGSADSDVGFVFNRANGLVANVALYWSEADSTFYTTFTNSGGATDANLAPTTYANLVTNVLSANTVSVPSFTTTGNITGGNILGVANVSSTTFTGSTVTGSKIGESCGRLHKRFSLEMGGKNPMIVLADADLDLVIEGLLWGAFGTTGQRCTVTSRLIVHEDVHDELVNTLKERASALKIGYGNEDDTEMGPVINQKAIDKIESYIAIGKEEGATLALGGNRAEGPGLEDGFFLEPTIFTNVTPNMRIAKEEIFGPVLSVIKISSYEEAVKVANNIEFGLSSAIYTQDIATAFRAMHEIEAGITYVNGPTIGAEAHMPFGGVKGTGNGHREGGWEVFVFYTETKTVYVDYSGKLQKAQIDNVED